MLPISRILVPYDWGEMSNRAFQLAASLALKNDAELVVLFVVPLPAVMYGPPDESYLKHMREQLGRVKPSDPTTRVKYQLAEGNPATEILRVAKETKCELIVIGTHGRTGLNRFVLGSVAEDVIRMAPCLVLTMTGEVPGNPLGEPQCLQASTKSNLVSIGP